jgi:hypothetical protein
LLEVGILPGAGLEDFTSVLSVAHQYAQDLVFHIDQHTTIFQNEL